MSPETVAAKLGRHHRPRGHRPRAHPRPRRPQPEPSRPRQPRAAAGRRPRAVGVAGQGRGRRPLPLLDAVEDLGADPHLGRGRHRAGHLVGADLVHALRGPARLDHRRRRGRGARHRTRADPLPRRCARPVHQGAQRAAADRARADLPDLVRTRSGLQGGLRRRPGLLPGLLQRLPGRPRGRPQPGRQLPDPGRPRPAGHLPGRHPLGHLLDLHQPPCELRVRPHRRHRRRVHRRHQGPRPAGRRLAGHLQLHAACTPRWRSSRSSRCSPRAC